SLSFAPGSEEEVVRHDEYAEAVLPEPKAGLEDEQVPVVVADPAVLGSHLHNHRLSAPHPEGRIPHDGIVPIRGLSERKQRIGALDVDSRRPLKHLEYFAGRGVGRKRLTPSGMKILIEQKRQQTHSGPWLQHRLE